MTLADLKQYDARRWHEIADGVKTRLETRHFIDGGYVDAVDGGRFETVDPATGETLAAVAAGNDKDIDAAVAAARAAFRSGVWSRMAPRARMAVMYRFAELIEENAAELAVLDTLCMGKPIRDMIGVDIRAMLLTIRFMGESIDKIEGKVTNTASDVAHFVLREPLGVVGAVTPWNFPMLMAAWKFAPALAAGNTLVLKPAEQAPLSCLRLAELFADAGGPPGVFNVVNGLGEAAGKPLALHDEVAKISFTGSTEVGKLMLQYAGQSNLKKVGLECGGKSPQVFLHDLPDMERAVETAYHAIYGNMGEACNAGSRIMLDRRIHDEFVERFTAGARQAYRPGDPLDPATTMGPLVTRQDQERVLALVDQGRSEGAELVFGGGVPEALERGAYVEPTLFTGVNNRMTIARQEIFGPVASVIPFDDVDEAIAIANDTIYGLAAGIWTRDLKTAHRFIREFEAGMVWVNTYDDQDMTQPFGGYKQSGNARDKCFESLLEYTQMKSAWISLA